MSVRAGGITIEIGGDVTGLSNALKKVNKEINSTQTQLKDVEKLLKLDPSNVELLSQKQTLLTKQIENTREKLNVLNETYDLLKQNESFDVNSKEALALRREIENCQISIQRMSEEIKGMGEISEDSFTVASKRLGELSDKINDVGESITEVGETISALSEKVYEIGEESVEQFGNFEHQLALVAAASGKTVEEIDNIKEASIELGNTTMFSAEEAASGFVILAQSGYDAEKSISLLPNILNLATAGEMELSHATEDMIAMMKGFKSETEDAGEVSQYYSDIVAKGATLAKTSTEQFADALTQVAANASTYGQTIEGTSTALLRLANQNVNAAEAGTMLFRVLQRLYTPTGEAADKLDELGVSAYDFAGRARDVNDVVEDLKSAVADLSEEERQSALETILSARGLTAFSKIAATSAEEVDAFRESLSDVTGAAQFQADTLKNTLNGQITSMTNKLKTLGATIGEKIAPNIEKATKKIEKLTEWFQSLNDETVVSIVKFGAFIALLGPAIVTIGKLSTGIGTLINVASKVTSIIPRVKNGIAAILSNPLSAKILLTASALAILTGATISLINRVKEARSEKEKYNSSLEKNNDLLIEESGHLDLAEQNISIYTAKMKLLSYETAESNLALQEMDERLESNTSRIADTTEALSKRSSAQEETTEGILAEYSILERYIEELSGIVDENGKIKEGYEERAKVITGELSDALDMEIEIVDGVIQNYNELNTSIEKNIALSKIKSALSAYEDDYIEAIKMEKDLTEQLNDATEDLNERKKLQKEAQDRYNEAQSIYNDLVAEAQAQSTGARNANTELQSSLTEAKNILDEASLSLDEHNTRLKESQENYDSASKSISDNIITITTYENALTASYSDNIYAMNEAVLSMTNGLQTAETATVESLKEQYDKYNEYYKTTVKMAEDKNNHISQSQIDTAYNLKETAKSYYEEAEKMQYAHDNLTAENVITALNGMTKSQQDAYFEWLTNLATSDSDMAEEYQSLIDEMKSASDGTYDIGVNIGTGLKNGIESMWDKVKKAASSLGSLATEAIQKAAQVHSPSKRTTWIGQMIDKGLVEGMNDGENAVYRTASKIANGTLNAISVSGGNGSSVLAGLGNGNTSNYSTTNNSTTNMGGITLNVYGSQGQNVNDLAEIVSQKISQQYNRSKAVFA